MFVAHQQGKRFHVFADETRPLLQGARLTAWELHQAGIDVTLICDSMAAQVMKEGKIQLVIVGADRSRPTATWRTRSHLFRRRAGEGARIPFYVAAPSSTFDLSLTSGDGIPNRAAPSRGEVTHGLGRQTAPEGVKVYNPAFDVTPAHLIAGIVTEGGVVRPASEETIRAALFC